MFSSNNCWYDLPGIGAFIGELSTNDDSTSMRLSSLSSILGASHFRRENGRVVCDATRLLLSLFGEGETGSPRNRLRALETADADKSGGFKSKFNEDVAEDSREC